MSGTGSRRGEAVMLLLDEEGEPLAVGPQLLKEHPTQVALAENLFLVGADHIGEDLVHDADDKLRGAFVQLYRNGGVLLRKLPRAHLERGLHHEADLVGFLCGKPILCGEAGHKGGGGIDAPQVVGQLHTQHVCIFRLAINWKSVLAYSRARLWANDASVARWLIRPRAQRIGL